MLGRTLLIWTICILSIFTLTACADDSGTEPTSDTPALDSDTSDASESGDSASSDTQTDPSDTSDATDGSDPSDPTDPSGSVESLDPGPCENALELVCGTQVRVNSADGVAAFENHPACDDTFRFPGKELRYHFQSTFNGKASVEFQRDGGLATTFMTFVYETNDAVCDVGSSCHAQGDDYQQPLEFDVRDGFAYHIFWDPRLFEDTASGTLTFRCDGFVCGDGNLDPGETCDDGNVSDSDGCSGSCALELGYACEGEPSVCTETLCGDGIILGTETCDDSNDVAGDGCSPSCMIEDGFHCVGEPSTCTDGLAGDVCSAAVAPTEEYLQGSTSGYSSGTEPYQGACGVMVSADGPDQWYRFTVPSGKVLSLEPYLAFEGMRVFVVEDCQTLGDTCVQTATDYASTYLLNNTGADKTVSVAVDGFLEADQGDYRIRQLLRDPSEFPQADHALNATVIGTGTIFGSTEPNNNLYSGYGGNCLNDNYGFHGFSGGADRVYAIEVGPGQTLNAEVTPTGGWDATLAISNDPADLSASCLSWRDTGVATATNSTDASTIFYVIVDGFYSYNRGEFSLTTSLD